MIDDKYNEVMLKLSEDDVKTALNKFITIRSDLEVMIKEFSKLKLYDNEMPIRWYKLKVSELTNFKSKVEDINKLLEEKMYGRIKQGVTQEELNRKLPKHTGLA